MRPLEKKPACVWLLPPGTIAAAAADAAHADRQPKPPKTPPQRARAWLAQRGKKAGVGANKTDPLGSHAASALTASELVVQLEHYIHTILRDASALACSFIIHVSYRYLFFFYKTNLAKLLLTK